jgi:hypothetical protein
VKTDAATAAHWKAHWKLHRVARRWINEIDVDVHTLWRTWCADRDAIVGCRPKASGSWRAWRTERAAIRRQHGVDAGDYFAPYDVTALWLTEHGVTGATEQLVIWLEWWRRKDQHLKQMQDNIRRNAQNRRMDFYRCTAASLVKRFARCELREIDLAALALRDLPEAEAKELHKAARRQRVQAAVYGLKQALKGAFGTESFCERRGDDEPPESARGIESTHESSSENEPARSEAE